MLDLLHLYRPSELKNTNENFTMSTKSALIEEYSTFTLRIKDEFCDQEVDASLAILASKTPRATLLTGLHYYV